MSRTPKTDALVKVLRRRGVTVLEHADWGSERRSVYIDRLTSRPHERLPEKPVDTLWNHITVTFDDGELVGDFKADLREVERIGWERFGSGVSYNILVDANAPTPRVAIGQFLEAKGTHTINDKGITGYSFDQNAVALAVAWVGVPGNRLNVNALAGMVQVRAALIEIGALTRGYDDVPHSLVAAKDCPTDELRDRLPALKKAALTDKQEDDMAGYSDWTQADKTALVQDILSATMNRDDPGGTPRFIGMSLREAIKEIHAATVDKTVT